MLKKLAISVFKALASQHSHGYRGYRGYYGYNRNRGNRKVFKRSLLNPYIIYTFIEQAKSVADRNRANKQNQQSQQSDQTVQTGVPTTTGRGINAPEQQRLTYQNQTE